MRMRNIHKVSGESILNQAILLIVFNRPDTTSVVFEAIRQARPTRLYVAGDGARSGRDDEVELCNQVREIATAVDWPCQLVTLFRSENLGCKWAVSSAINWFFEHEEAGIILEDDVVPVPSFFLYCDEMLDFYKNNEKVMMISGCNMIANNFVATSSYFFTRYVHIWGWATWRRAWKKYDVAMTEWPQWRESDDLSKFLGKNKKLTSSWTQIFDAMHRGTIDTWDYQWVFACWKNNGLSILPKNNLIKNIGFGEGATHTNFGEPAYLLESKPAELEFPLSHPENITRSVEADILQERYIYGLTTITNDEVSHNMEYKTIEQLHKSKTGKLSDKWASYLTYYDTLFAGWESRPIKMLEIGVQNGGSLETWASYFKSAQTIIGCDIDERCSALKYDDSRIHIVIGDACKPDAFQKIRNISISFDLIIDDGSHISTDILNAFLSYFPLVNPGGTYIIEDAHCLYLDDFSGGLLNDFGGYAFFKKLVDIVSFQFWRDQASIGTYLRTYFHPNNIPKFILDGEIESIEFRNSIITIKKSLNPGHEKLGERLKVGSDASVQNWGG
jgi:cephalosporin hydroxylase